MAAATDYLTPSTDELDDTIERLVAEAPPLSAATKATLAALLGGAR